MVAITRIHKMRRIIRLKKPLPFLKLLPNFITLIGLIFGMNAIRFAIDAKWELSVICILIAAFVDALDGRIARLLNATSIFGAELDSLCDFANFGIAPSIIIYLWALQDTPFKLLAWGSVLLFVICMAIRLARFNTMNPLDNITLKNYFIGIPAPVGAMMMMIPIMMDFNMGPELGITVKTQTLSIIFWQIFMALMLASRIYTFSIKNIHIKPEYIWLYLFCGAILIIALILYNWYVLPIIGLLYLSSIPLSVKIAKQITHNQ